MSISDRIQLPELSDILNILLYSNKKSQCNLQPFCVFLGEIYMYMHHGHGIEK